MWQVIAFIIGCFGFTSACVDLYYDAKKRKESLLNYEIANRNYEISQRPNRQKQEDDRWDRIIERSAQDMLNEWKKCEENHKFNILIGRYPKDYPMMPPLLIRPLYPGNPCYMVYDYEHTENCKYYAIGKINKTINDRFKQLLEEHKNQNNEESKGNNTERG